MESKSARLLRALPQELQQSEQHLQAEVGALQQLLDEEVAIGQHLTLQLQAAGGGEEVGAAAGALGARCRLLPAAGCM
jgi:hypothetical protein